ncbi:hypothetical protein [Halobacterium jilantaiense]|uniref:Uncharacterized protein n=1 Tax=Halobacterium jilantaiense TaxID=355548 RepID=A0A1I0QDI0_9EURY|nr:hypothetical protein [Halobacterium jilantaiense]SEW24659.1 hypothetical protein SAMN04487945_2477 [Halobacterium jilantaiense]
MSTHSVDTSRLLTESRRIGAIVLVGFLLAHLLVAVVDTFMLDLLYGVKGLLAAVIRYTTLLTALCYVLASDGVGTPSAATPGGD